MNVFYSDSETDLKLWCVCCIKFHLFKGVQDDLIDRQLCVTCYYPTSPTDLPYKRHVCGPFCSCNIFFCGYLRFFSISLVWIIWYSTLQYNTLCSTVFVRFISQCWCFNPQWTAGQAINKCKLCLEQYYSLKELHRCYVSTYKSGFMEGVRRLRGSIMFTQRNHDLHFSCSLPEHCCNSDRSEQHSSKLDTLSATSLHVLRLFKAFTVCHL
jgi:hypothetical protein